MMISSPSREVATEAVRGGPPSKVILLSSLAFGICGFAALKFGRADSFLSVVGLGLLQVCCLPWLVVLRRGIWSRRYPDGGKWMTTATILLWASLLIGPLVTGAFWMWNSFQEVSADVARVNSFGVIISGVLAFSAAFWFAPLAFLIQLWRDQWRAKLTATTVAFLFLLFVAYAWEMTKPSPSGAGQSALQTARP